jgi:dihydroxyacetone kinase DhaKLM complex PTS-EIIA-like component DhaM
MRDKAVSNASAQDGAAVPSPAIIRGMANTLCDSDTDLLDTTAIVTRLVCAGWPPPLIEGHYLAAVLMAMTRKVNEMRK